jgi:hypothetical protein
MLKLKRVPRKYARFATIFKRQLHKLVWTGGRNVNIFCGSNLECEKTIFFLSCATGLIGSPIQQLSITFIGNNCKLISSLFINLNLSSIN